MKMKRNSLLVGIVSLAALASFTASSSFAGAATPAATTRTGEVFVIGTDAPLASVASFSVQISGIEAYNTSTGASAQLLASPTTVDFARFDGLQTLLNIGAVPVGTYDQIIITIGQPSLGTLVTTAGNPPTIQYMTPTLTSGTVTKTLEHFFTVTEAEPIGIRMDFDLHKSIMISGGQIMGVDPIFNVSVVGPDAPGAYIDEFDTAVVSPDLGAQSFTVQGPHGHIWTIDVNGQTQWDDNATLADLNANTIVQISGTLDRATSTITADEVTILSQNGFYAGGLSTYVTAPSAGAAASSFDLYVRGLLPASGTGANGVKLGEIATVDLSATDKYFLRWNRHRLPEALSELVFNASAILPGQSIGVGGPLTGAANANAVTVNRVTLRDFGYVGTVVKGSVRVGKDTFQMKVDGFAGQLIPQTINVYLTDWSVFRDGYTGIHEIAGGDLVRVVGLLIKNPINGETILIGRYVDALD
jgi:hypothetical protein